MSVCQGTMTDVGTTIRCGPQMPRSHASQASIEMVMSVLPRPISSARMPLRFFSFMLTIQSRATCWWPVGLGLGLGLGLG